VAYYVRRLNETNRDPPTRARENKTAVLTPEGMAMPNIAARKVEEGALKTRPIGPRVLLVDD
jgi:hypothetical protein